MKTTNPQEVTTTNVLKVYSGRARKCMCGCAGRYFVAPENRAAADADRGYPYEDRDVNAAQVTRVLRTVQAEAATGNVLLDDEGEWMSADVGNRRYCVYFKST